MHHTGIDTVGGTVTGRVHDRGDEVDIGTVITKKVIVRGEKFSEGVPRSVRCNVATGLQYIHRKRSSAALSWSCGQCGGGGQFEIYTFWMKF